MNFLFEIIHPGDVHFFRLAIAELQQRSHNVAVTAREKDVAIPLLENYRIPFVKLTHVGKGPAGLFVEMLMRDYKLWRFCRQFKPDVLTSVSGVFASHAGFLTGKPAVVWDDTEHQKQIHILTWPFARYVLTPDCYTKSAGKKQRTYPGCHELAYLHPRRFTPDPDVLRQNDIDPDSRYCVIRMVSWGAIHDVGQRGLDEKKKIVFVNEIARYARPYITSEGPLPHELEPYRMTVPVHHIHHLLAFASLCVAEGATVASEACVLGVPTIYVNSLKLGYLNMMEDYGLLWQSLDMDDIQNKAVSLLQQPGTTENARAAREKLLRDKIDMTSFIVETLEKAAHGEEL